MADSPAFDCVCEKLEEATSLDRLQARGTVRLALKQAGLDAHSVTPDQMCVVVEKVLPSELAIRGIEDCGGICTRLATAVAKLVQNDSDETPDMVFARLGRES